MPTSTLAVEPSSDDLKRPIPPLPPPGVDGEEIHAQEPPTKVARLEREEHQHQHQHHNAGENNATAGLLAVAPGVVAEAVMDVNGNVNNVKEYESTTTTTPPLEQHPAAIEAAAAIAQAVDESSSLVMATSTSTTTTTTTATAAVDVEEVDVNAPPENPLDLPTTESTLQVVVAIKNENGAPTTTTNTTTVGTNYNNVGVEEDAGIEAATAREASEGVTQHHGANDIVEGGATGGRAADVKTEEGLDEETAREVIDMAVGAVNDMAAANAAAVTAKADAEGMKKLVIDMAVGAVNDMAAAAVVTAKADAEGMPPLPDAEQGRGGGVAVPTTIKKVVILDAEHGNVLKETIIEQQLPQQQQLPPSSLPKKPKKERKEFTAQEKLQILSELDGPSPPSVQSILEKYGVSKSSLHRWRQPDKIERLQEMVGGGKPGEDGQWEHTTLLASKDKLKKRDMNDRLHKIKMDLQTFCKENLARPENEQMAITSSLIQLKANEIKDDLLKRHEAQESSEVAMPSLLSEEEVTALKAFKGSKSWACLIGNQLGYLSSANPATGAPIVWSDVAKNNTALYLEQHSRKPHKAKKQRQEFTAQEKLMILQELEDTNAKHKAGGTTPITVEQICLKYGTSKSSLHRWKQQYKNGRLQHLATQASGFSNSKRVFNDKLHSIKKALNDFHVENETATEKVPMNYTTLQARAMMARDQLLERYYKTITFKLEEHALSDARDDVYPDGTHEQQQHEQAVQVGEGQVAAEIVDQGVVEESSVPVPGEVKTEQIQVEESAQQGNTTSGVCGGDEQVITKEEAVALENFKCSNSWLRETAKKFGWKLDIDSKKDLGVPMDSLMDNSVAAAAAAAAAVYHHHPDQHVVHHDPSVEHHYHHDVHATHHPEHTVLVHHGAAVEEQLPVAQQVHHHHQVVEHPPMEQQTHYQEPPPQHEQQQQLDEQPMAHLAPNMEVYDAQGNVVPEVLEDPLVQVEEHDVIVNENGTNVEI